MKLMKTKNLVVALLLLSSCLTAGRSKEDALIKAVVAGDTLAVQNYLNEGVDPYSVDSYGSSILHIASKAGNIEMIDLILSYGSDNISSIDLNKLTPLHYAVLNNQKECSNLLLDNGASLRPVGTYSVFFGALSFKNSDAVKYLLEERNVVDLSKEKYPVITASMNQMWDLIPLIVEKGGDVKELEGKGRSSLRYALEDLETTKFLIDSGANMNNIPNDGVTPISAAIISNNLEAAKLLLELGAEVNPKYAPELNKEVTPLPPLVACSVVKGEEYISFARDLLDNGADINYIVIDGDKMKASALYYAVYTSNPKMVEFLIDNGADTQYKTDFGTALEVAIKNSDQEIIALLKGN